MTRTGYAPAVLVESLLAEGYGVRFRASGRSMQPTIQDGDALILAPAAPARIRTGDIVLVRRERFVAHRVIKMTALPDGSVSVLTRGDASICCDPSVTREAILGKVVAVERAGQRYAVDSVRSTAAYFCRQQVAIARRIVARIWRLTITSHGNRASLSHKTTNSPIPRSPADPESSPN